MNNCLSLAHLVLQKNSLSKLVTKHMYSRPTNQHITQTVQKRVQKQGFLIFTITHVANSKDFLPPHPAMAGLFSDGLGWGRCNSIFRFRRGFSSLDFCAIIDYFCMPAPKTQFVDEPLAKKRLRVAVARRRKALQLVIAEIEETREELHLIKLEYDRRIGRLYLRIEEIDEEIFEQRRLHDLLLKNIPIADAKRITAERARAQREREEAKAEDQGRLQEEINASAKKIKPAEREELKRVWRQLAFRFHPDLVASEEEKSRREHMMKRVNEAYNRSDLKGLQALAVESGEAQNEEVDDVSMENLEQNLMDIEACIRRMKQKLQAFHRSEWYAWKEGIATAKKKKQDFFAVHEKNTRKSVVAKERELAKIKEMVTAFK